MTLTSAVSTRRQRPVRTTAPSLLRPAGLTWAIAAEGFASLLGFAALAHQARSLGPSAFAQVEYAAAVVAWLLVLVRGGVDVVVYREAARRTRLVGRLTDLLIGLRCVSALIGYLGVLTIAYFLGPERGQVVAIAGLALFASVWVADVGPRANGRLGLIAIAQTIRALGFLAAVSWLVRGPGDALRAAACLVMGELAGVIVPLAVHSWEHGFPRIVVRGRASRVLASRGMVAGVTRFGRVTLYGLDLLALGWWTEGDVGQYAAARRIVFALVALGLVVPSLLGPWLAKAWAQGTEIARERVGEALGWLWSLSLPAALGLALHAERWMPVLFGDAYASGGPLLALIAARLPCLLAASFTQSALTACRRDDWAFRLVFGQIAIAAILTPTLAVTSGPVGVGWSSLLVEATGTLAGWALLARLNVAPSWLEQTGRALVGCVGLVAGCRLMQGAPLPAVVMAGALGYGAVWRLAGRSTWLRGQTR